jgi:hypothetical protein
MPTKKSAAAKFSSPRQPTKIRAAAADFGLATRARRSLGKLAFGKPKTSKVHRDYVAVDKAYQSAGRKLAKLTGYKWKTKRK